jgi:predicted DNA binding CopG/RHH family protein
MERNKTKDRMRYLKSVDEIPRFKTEAAEAEFWSTHSLAEIWDQLEPIEIELTPEPRRITLRRAPKKPVTLRLEAQQIARAKELARARSLSYQALLRSWISEGIAREERLKKLA